jgi:hypothetical protein
MRAVAQIICISYVTRWVLHCAVATVFMMHQQHGLDSPQLDDLLQQWLNSFTPATTSTAAASKQHPKLVHGTTATSITESEHKLLTCALVTAYFQLHTALQFTTKVRAKQHMIMSI